MSQQVQVDYQAIAIKCNSVCEVAERRLKELDEIMEQLKSTSTSLMTAEAQSLAASISNEREMLSRQISAVRAKANAEASMGRQRMSNHDPRFARRDDAMNAANELQARADALAEGRIMEFRSLLVAILDENLQTMSRKRKERASGIVSLDAATQAVLDGIPDEVLRQFTYLAYLQDNMLAGEALKAAGKKLMDEMTTKTYEERLEEENRRIQAELEAARVDKAVAAKVMAAGRGAASAKEELAARRQSATQEIVGEKVRQKSMRMIMKAIEARGFIVDKKNVRINRETNEVNMVALKASGEKAQFTVYLDGKFIYDFHGYEGQACQKDIQPFLDDLEEVYGLHVTKQTEIWSNPDKISNMHYQTVKTNRQGE